jgi:hypothetical protein
LVLLLGFDPLPLEVRGNKSDSSIDASKMNSHSASHPWLFLMPIFVPIAAKITKDPLSINAARFFTAVVNRQCKAHRGTRFGL